jgi:protoheme IX farnesyltransferase
MITTKTDVNTSNSLLTEKFRAYVELLKLRLSFLVSFSGGIGYALAADGPINWPHLALFSLAGFLVTGASNIINQIIEIDLDKLMKRTVNRPLPSGRLSVKEALLFCLFIGFTGFYILFFHVNLLAGLLTFLSLILYGFVYTPLKRVGPIAVFVGAFPGALPPLIGWVASAGTIGTEAFTLFAIQFIWQFPHFWAIAWVLDDDYKNAGFKLLPSGGGRDMNTAFQIMIYTLFLIPLGVLPAKFGVTGINAAVIAVVCGVLFLMQTFYLMKECSQKAALQMMFGSFIYLPVVQIAFLLDKV